ncbi:MAG: Pectin methylesterase [Oscillospiraceae bacterium]|jgi:pectinesterase|nr:Pectin methylesterase [Oscillospiraceae bacterium]
MLTLRVGKGSDISTISQALAQVPSEQPLTLLLAGEVFWEKVFCERSVLRLVGAGPDKTKILWQDGAYDPHADGRNNGTFRSYTAFFDGDRLMAENLTIENAAGDGRLSGQAIAAAVHTRYAWFKNVHFISFQDTLFLGPLPEKERLPDGFLGPRQHAPRIPTQQLYEDCRVTGDVDFIFGGGDVLFRRCRLHGIGDRIGYLAAPCTTQDGMGFIFDRCNITSDRPRQLYLARPWRTGARAVFLNCDTCDAISSQGFDAWECAPSSFEFLEYPSPQEKHDYSRVLSSKEANGWLQAADRLERIVKMKF